MDRPRRVEDIGPPDYDREVEVQGWVEDVRNLGGIAFILLRQRGGTLQVTAIKKEDRELFKELTSIPRESVVAIQGVVKANKEARYGWEVIPRSLRLLSKAEAPLPLGVVDKVGAELDTRLDSRFMDLRKPAVRAIFELEALFLKGVRRCLEDQGFVEVHTPKLVAAGAEGGATLFPVKYFDRQAYLAQSPQLYKQILMASGLDRIYEVAPAFRAELSDTVRHLSEFISLDMEMAYIQGPEDVMALAEEVTTVGVEAVIDEGRKLLETLGTEVSRPRRPYPRVTYRRALDILRSKGRDLKPRSDIDTEGERLLGQAMAQEGHEAYFITEYPALVKPFYIMVKDEEPDYTFGFDLDYRGVEMASGGQREHRLDHLVKRMEALGLSPASFDFYLKAFRYGMPPHGGWAIGPERWVMKMLNLGNIREATLFPRDRNRLEP